MVQGLIDRLRPLRDGPRDGALLRYSLANAWLAQGSAEQAVAEARRALEFDAKYSAAWKLLGLALVEAGDAEAARATWRDGIVVAESVGDVQAAKEMRVFLRRLDKQASIDANAQAINSV